MEQAEKSPFMSISKIQIILGCSYTKAQSIAHSMIMQGQGFQDGRLLRVRVDAFEKRFGVKVA